MGTKYANLLVAVGFSAADEAVLARAALLARQNGASLTLVHVVEYLPMAYPDEIPPLESVEIEKALEQRALADLGVLRESLHPLEARVVVRTGVAKHEVVQVAEEVGADLILVGSHGRHGLQLLLGSTANGVLHLAQCDVLAVRVH